MPMPMACTLNEYPKRCQAPYCKGTHRRPTLADAIVGRTWCSDCNGYEYVSEADRRVIIEEFEEKVLIEIDGPISTGY